MAGDVLSVRRGGMLCHLTSLPGDGPTGTLGSSALELLDFLHRAGLSVWQMLPLNPPDEYGSPYHSESLFALNVGVTRSFAGLCRHPRVEAFRADACRCIRTIRDGTGVLAVGLLQIPCRRRDSRPRLDGVARTVANP